LSRPDPGAGRLRRADAAPAFVEPWHAQALAMADLLVRSGRISAARWAEALAAEIATAATQADAPETYFRAVLAALERLLAADGAIAPAELEEREHAWERAYLDTPHGQPVKLR
jgi:nitrile hydratase accessory protein